MGKADAAGDALSRVRFIAGVVALCCAAAPALLRAQQPQPQQAPPPAQPVTLEIRADNDAFDFWEGAPNRPDEEYTSGVRAALQLTGAAWWEKWVHPRTAPCGGAVVPCATHTYALGQDIYTGQLVGNDTTHVYGTRPNAGWLYVQEASRIERRNRLDETSVTVGVTGPPALGEVTQNFAHSLDTADNRPTNWTEQLPFEPGIVLAWDHTERVLAVGEGKAFGFDFEPHGGASLGNILTEARAGLKFRTGFRMQHPWIPVPVDTTDTWPGLMFFADATMHAVARNEFLAGTMFRDSPRVDERPFVPEYQVGVTFRLEQVSFSWVAHQLPSEYFSRTEGHAWSRIEFVYRFAR